MASKKNGSGQIMGKNMQSSIFSLIHASAQSFFRFFPSATAINVNINVPRKTKFLFRSIFF